MTKVSPELERHWQYNAPEPLQSGSAEQRAARAIEMLQLKEQFKGGDDPSRRFQALALDLMLDCFPKNSKPPKAVIDFLKLALGLRLGHPAPFGWGREELETRGGRNADAMWAAFCHDHYGLSDGAFVWWPKGLSDLLRREGFTTHAKTIAKWRASALWSELRASARWQLWRARGEEFRRWQARQFDLPEPEWFAAAYEKIRRDREEKTARRLSTGAKS